MSPLSDAGGRKIGISPSEFQGIPQNSVVFHGKAGEEDEGLREEHWGGNVEFVPSEFPKFPGKAGQGSEGL